MTEPHAEPPLAPAPEAPLVALPGAILPLVRLLPPPEGVILAPPEPPDATRRTWFFSQLWSEMVLAFRMYFDPRYRVSRTAQVAFPLFAALLVLNYFVFAVWFAYPIVSPVLERMLDVVVVVIAYRVLVRELDRYRTVLDYLTRYAPPR
jgi:hypothetical protein